MGQGGGGCERKLIPADLFDSPRNPIAVQRPEGFQGLDDHQAEGAVEDVVLVGRHVLAVDSLQQGTLYPALLKLEQMGWISSKWGTSETGRRVRLYALTRAGRKQLQKEEAQWQRAASIVERFLKISENPS